MENSDVKQLQQVVELNWSSGKILWFCFDVFFQEIIHAFDSNKVFKNSTSISLVMSDGSLE